MRDYCTPDGNPRHHFNDRNNTRSNRDRRHNNNGNSSLAEEMVPPAMPLVDTSGRDRIMITRTQTTETLVHL